MNLEIIKTMNFEQMEQVNGGRWMDSLRNNIADIDAATDIVGIDLRKLDFEDNMKDGCIKSLSLYVASIEIAISNKNVTKGIICHQEREAIGRAASNDKVASVLFGWAFGTATGGPAGGVFGAIRAIIWELM